MVSGRKENMAAFKCIPVQRMPIAFERNEINCCHKSKKQIFPTKVHSKMKDAYCKIAPCSPFDFLSAATPGTLLHSSF